MTVVVCDCCGARGLCPCRRANRLSTLSEAMRDALLTMEAAELVRASGDAVTSLCEDCGQPTSIFAVVDPLTVGVLDVDCACADPFWLDKPGGTS